MNKEETKLFSRVQKLVKKANMRILRLEKETGLESPFAVKELKDYLDEFAITKTGRVRITKKWDLTQLKIVDKAVRDFLESDVSSAGKVKKYKKEQESIRKKELTFKQADIIYRMTKYWTWILDALGIDKSEWFAFYVQPCNLYNWSQEKWIEEISSAMEKVPDEQLRGDLIDLYIYFKD